MRRVMLADRKNRIYLAYGYDKTRTRVFLLSSLSCFLSKLRCKLPLLADQSCADGRFERPARLRAVGEVLAAGGSGGISGAACMRETFSRISDICEWTA